MYLKIFCLSLLATIIFFIASCNNNGEAGSDHQAADSNIKASEIFVNGFNTGNPYSLSQAVSQIFTVDFLQNNGGSLSYATDALELFRTYGPLAFSFNDTSAAPDITWFKGTISSAWVGYQFHPDSVQRNKMRKLTTWRARPVPYPDYPQTETSIADSLNIYTEKISNAGLFSGSITLSRNSNVLLNKSYGTNKWDNPSPINQSTRFHTASVTKLFTAVLILQLAEQGILNLNDTLGKFIPEYPQPYRSRVKVIHLLNHTSGIELDDSPAYLKEISSARNSEGLLSAQLKAVSGKELINEPGTTYNYTSEGFDLLGVIIERVTKKSWKKNVEEKIFVTARMPDSRVQMPVDEGNYAVGKTSLREDLQTSDTGGLKNAMDILPRYAKPSSGIWSTARDLNLFMTSLLDNRLLSKKWADTMCSENMMTYENPKYGLRSWVGLGMQGEDLWGIPTFGHGGVVPGFSALIEYIPHNKWLLTVTSNSGEASAFVIFQRFLELTLHY